MAISDKDYRLVVELSNDNGPTFNNVWYFKATASSVNSASNLAEAFKDTIALQYTAIISVSTELTRLIVTNLDDPEDFGEFPLTGYEGQLTGEYMPDFVGWTFKINRPTTLVRNGRKTIGRIREADVENGGPISTIVSALNDFAAEPFPNIFDASDPVAAYNLAIPKSVLVTNENPPPDEHYVIQELYVATSMNFVRVSSQNSRKSF